MIIFVIIAVALISVVMALISLWKQNKIEEVKRAQKSLKRQKVIFHSGS